MKHDCIQSNYGLYDCYKCLCEVCTRIGCPKNVKYRSKLDHCLHMRLRLACPTVKCDWFVHREKRRFYKIVKRHRRVDAIMEKLSAIEKKLDGNEK